MNVSSISSSTLGYNSHTAALAETQRSRKNLSKDDLAQMSGELQAANPSMEDLFQSLVDNYEKVDTNGDGISFDEMQTYAKANGLSLPQGPPPSGGMGGGPKAMSEEELIAMRDDLAAQDSEAAEGLTQVIENFDEADTDKNGEISLEEMMAFTEANGIEMPKPPAPPEPSAAQTTATESSANDASAEGLLKIIQQSIQAYMAYGTEGSLSESTLGAGLVA